MTYGLTREAKQQLNHAAAQTFAKEVKKAPPLTQLCIELAAGIEGVYEGFYDGKRATYTSHCKGHRRIKVKCTRGDTVIFNLVEGIFKPVRILRQGRTIDIG